MPLAGHWVYVLRCSDGTLYTGYTTDLSRRMTQHNMGKAAKYTKGRGPVEIVFSDRYKSKGGALKEELRIKKMSREAKLALCRGYKSHS